MVFNFLVLSIIVYEIVKYTKKEIIVKKNNIIKLLNHENIYSGRTKQTGRQFDMPALMSAIFE